jgi:hypothetical protein
MPRLASPAVVLGGFTDDDIGLVQETSADPLIPLITTDR